MDAGNGAIVHRAIGRLRDRGIPITILAVRDELQSGPYWEMIGGDDGLSDVVKRMVPDKIYQDFVDDLVAHGKIKGK